MRKILSTLMACCLVLLSSSTVVLADGNTNVNDGNNVVFIDSDGPALYYNPNIESETIYTLPTRYDQNDYSDPLGTCSADSNLTIANAGCTLTTVAMVRDFFKGTPYQNPAQLNTSFMIPQNMCSMLWYKISALGLSLVRQQTGLNYSYSNNNMTSFAQTIQPYLDDGNLIIVELEGQVDDDPELDYHFLIINGYTKLVEDAGGGYALYVTNSGQTDWYSISETLSDGWIRIIQFLAIGEA